MRHIKNIKKYNKWVIDFKAGDIVKYNKYLNHPGYYCVILNVSKSETLPYLIEPLDYEINKDILGQTYLASKEELKKLNLDDIDLLYKLRTIKKYNL